jgi:hypothetical protein
MYCVPLILGDANNRLLCRDNALVTIFAFTLITDYPRCRTVRCSLSLVEYSAAGKDPGSPL